MGSGMETRRRSVVKALVWNAMGLAMMTLVGLIATGSAALGGMVALVNTAIGGQRIQEYMDNSTIHQCRNRSATGTDNGQLYWEGQLFGSQVLPFADMTLKGWLWYQGVISLVSPRVGLVHFLRSPSNCCTIIL